MKTLTEQGVYDHGLRPLFRDCPVPEPRISVSDSNPICGDDLTFHCQVVDGIITEIGFTGQACCLTLATADILCHNLIRQPVAALGRDWREIVNLTVGINRQQCILLPIQLVRRLREENQRQTCL